MQHIVGQETVATGTQVAAAQTGGNTIQDDRPAQPAGTTLGADVSSGAATAVGSRDQSSVAQQAQLDLSGQAVGNLLQVALILNVGAALANSGLNGIATGPGGSGVSGAIASGNATALGNDSQQYLTQAARATGDADTDSSVEPLAVSLKMGVAQAGSGVNAVVGTGVAGTGGSVGAGNATAIGNRSSTYVAQVAKAAASGDGVARIVQEVPVANVGAAGATPAATRSALPTPRSTRRRPGRRSPSQRSCRACWR